MYTWYLDGQLFINSCRKWSIFLFIICTFIKRIIIIYTTILEIKPQMRSVSESVESWWTCRSIDRCYERYCEIVHLFLFLYVHFKIQRSYSSCNPKVVGLENILSLTLMAVRTSMYESHVLVWIIPPWTNPYLQQNQ